MNAFITLVVAATFALNSAQAQDKKQQKKEAVTVARATVAADKADLKRNKEARAADKDLLDEPALKADRKAHRRKEVRLLKDQVKKDTKIVKEKI